MRMAITVSIPEDLDRELTQFVQKKRLNKSVVIKMALQDYLFRNQFLGVRDRLVPKARAKGIYTDQDVAERLK
jgi:metal-responsive CopG/Arc/MetJ family transcriptional regulator